MALLKKLIIIPAYNEEANLPGLLEELRYCDGYDIAVIDDGSTDSTSSMAKAAGNAKIIVLPFNSGIGGAMQTGFLYALYHGYDIAVQIDGDGQHDPAFLQQITAPLEEGRADMVIGSRFVEKEGFQSSCLRRLGISLLSLLIKLTSGSVIKDTTSGFRAVNAAIIKIFAKEYPRDYPEPETNARLLRLGMRIIEVPVQMRKRKSGTSSISAPGSLWYMLKVSASIIIDYMRKDG